MLRSSASAAVLATALLSSSAALLFACTEADPRSAASDALPDGSPSSTAAAATKDAGGGEPLDLRDGAAPARDDASDVSDATSDAGDASDAGAAPDASDSGAPPCTYTATVLAGNPEQAFAGAPSDGVGAAATFRSIIALRVDPTSGDLIALEGSRIRRITPGGVVSTVASSINYSNYASLAVDDQGAIYYVSNLQEIHRLPKGGGDDVLPNPNPTEYWGTTIFAGPGDTLYQVAGATLPDGTAWNFLLSMSRSGGARTRLAQYPVSVTFTDMGLDSAGHAYLMGSDEAVRVTTIADGTTATLAAPGGRGGIAVGPEGEFVTGNHAFSAKGVTLPNELPADSSLGYGAARAADGTVYGTTGTYYDTGWSMAVVAYSGCPIH